MKRRRQLVPVKGPKSIAHELEAQAEVLRKVASNWCRTGIPPQIKTDGQPPQHCELSYIDLIDDATAMEADAAKLRKAYS